MLRDELKRELGKARCLPFQDVLFALLPTSYSTREGDQTFVLDWALVRIDSDGTLQKLKPRAAPRQKPLRLRSIYAAGDNQYSFTIEKVFDFDGDGSPELMIEFTDAVYEGPLVRTVELWTSQKDALVRYAKDPRAPSVPDSPKTLVEDVDRDGRPDILTRGPYYNVGVFDCGAGGTNRITPSVFVFHGRADGSFSDEDEGAQQVLKKWCPQKPTRATLSAALHTTRGEHGALQTDELVHAVLCARAWGEGAPLLLAQLAPDCHAIPEDACEENGLRPRHPPSCPQWLIELVNITPRVRLR